MGAHLACWMLGADEEVSTWSKSGLGNVDLLETMPLLKMMIKTIKRKTMEMKSASLLITVPASTVTLAQKHVR